MILKEKMIEKHLENIDAEENPEEFEHDFMASVIVKTTIDMMPSSDVNEFGEFLYRLYFDDEFDPDEYEYADDEYEEDNSDAEYDEYEYEYDDEYDDSDDEYEYDEEPTETIEYEDDFQGFSVQDVKEMVSILGSEDASNYQEILYYLEKLGYNIVDTGLSTDASLDIEYSELDALLGDMTDDVRDEYEKRLMYALDSFDTEDDELNERMTPYISSKIRRMHLIPKKVDGYRKVGYKGREKYGKVPLTIQRMRLLRVRNTINRKLSGEYTRSRRYRIRNRYILRIKRKNIKNLQKKGKWSNIHHIGYKEKKKKEKDKKLVQKNKQKSQNTGNGHIKKNNSSSKKPKKKFIF